MIFTTLNGLFPLFYSVKEFLNSEKKEGNATYGDQSFDLMTFREHSITQVEDDLGCKKIALQRKILCAIGDHVAAKNTVF